MPYVIRNTMTPEYDIERNWSAWIYGAWDTEAQALQSLAEDSALYDDYRDRYPDLEGSEILEKIIDTAQYDVRYNKAYGKWQHVHHEGLSCYELEAETEEEAQIEAQTTEAPWHGFGETTCGKVRLICHIRDSLYLFECDDTWTEDY